MLSGKLRQLWPRRQPAQDGQEASANAIAPQRSPLLLSEAGEARERPWALAAPRTFFYLSFVSQTTHYSVPEENKSFQNESSKQVNSDPLEFFSHLL